MAGPRQESGFVACERGREDGVYEVREGESERARVVGSYRDETDRRAGILGVSAWSSSPPSANE